MAEAARYWRWVAAALLVRLALISFPGGSLRLSTRPEVATPLTSVHRLAEGYWLKKSSVSPYSGSMYHGSPLLLAIVGPLTVKRTEGQLDDLFYGLILIIADFTTAMLLRVTGQNLQLAYTRFLKSKDLSILLETSRNVDAGEVASLIFLWNPFGILSCVGLSTSPIENLMVVLSLYGACSSLAPLSAFGWVIATHLSLYPAILIVPVILLLGYGPDAPPKKLFLLKSLKPTGGNPLGHSHDQFSAVDNQSELQVCRFSWRPVLSFILWASIWSFYALALSSISLKNFGGLSEMFKNTFVLLGFLTYCRREEDDLVIF
uniref:Phosphatidylinositol glycan anchor biosynthesis class U protein n=1 Tax=Anthurium amnicola TaxID=1678845 RepID=A0A1D1Z0C3_9ARAE